MVKSSESTCNIDVKHRIKSIWAINFQAHRKSKIILSDGITGLIGTNDVGKTALSLRVLNLLRFNRPVGGGTRYIRDGEKKSVIGTEFGDGSKVIMHLYRKGSNKYVIKEPDGTKKELKVIGKNVPDEVIEKFGNFGEINLQTQRETAFFILDTAGKVAQLINMTKGIGRVDKVISKIKTKISNVDLEIEETQEDIKDTKDKLDTKRFKSINKFQINLRLKLKILDKIKKIRKKNENIVELVRQLADAEDREKFVKDKVITEKELNNLTTLYDNLDALNDDTILLEECIEEYNKCVIDENKIEIVSKDEDLLFTKMLKLRKKAEKLNTIIAEFIRIEREEKLTKFELAKTTKELKFIFDKLDICPLCNTILRKK